MGHFLQHFGVFVFVFVCLFVTGRATAGIAFTQQAILSFFAPQWRHDSQISVKFLPCQIREYLGVSGPKNAKNCQNFQLFLPGRGEPLVRC